MSEHHGSYYLPKPSHWPIMGSIALFCIMIGLANWLHGTEHAPYLVGVGGLLLIIVIFGWFGTVIRESQAGLYDKQVDRTFRWGMVWFIFSEVAFFCAFFGSLFYVRMYATDWLGGTGAFGLSHYILWPNFKDIWPLLTNPDPHQFVGPKSVMETWGIPAINTALLLSSGATITWAHWGLLKNNRKQLVLGLALTIVLGIMFLILQVHEYQIAYVEKGLTLASGIYGSTFFMLTGFHGLHVTLGTIMLIVIFLRSIKGHFNSEHHFGFEAVSWYWHFVDVVWLGLFIFVYWF